MNGLAELIQEITSSKDWRKASRCSKTSVEMVPSSEGAYVNEGPEVLQAKLVCAACPVRDKCLADAGRNGGVWGGLTLIERDRIRVSMERYHQPRPVVECAQCGLDCVPLMRDLHKCDTCMTSEERPQGVQAQKATILAMLADGFSYGDMAERLGLKKDAIGKAVRGWGEKGNPGRRSVPGELDDMDLAPCGTPAGRRRHERAGEKAGACACFRPGHANPNRVRSNGWAA